LNFILPPILSAPRNCLGIAHIGILAAEIAIVFWFECMYYCNFSWRNRCLQRGSKKHRRSSLPCLAFVVCRAQIFVTWSTTSCGKSPSTLLLTAILGKLSLKLYQVEDCKLSLPNHWLLLQWRPFEMKTSSIVYSSLLNCSLVPYNQDLMNYYCLHKIQMYV
jgi:hypothetical protein